MGEYLKKDDDMFKVIKESNPSIIEEQLAEKEDYDLISDLLDNSETLVKGIILSEILGKPKAKR